VSEQLDTLTGREIDALVAEKVMGWRVIGDAPNAMTWVDEADKSFPGGKIYTWFATSYPSFRPSTDIAAAWMVLLKLEELDSHAIVRVSNGDSDSCDVSILPDGGSELGLAHVSLDGGLELAPLAICKAALRAKEVTA